MILKKRTKTGVTVTPVQTYKSVGLEIDRATPWLQLLPVEVLVCGYLEEKFNQVPTGTRLFHFSQECPSHSCI